MTSLNPSIGPPISKQPAERLIRQPASVANARSGKRLPVIAWVGIGILGFFAFFAAIFLLVWSLTAGAADSTNTFLSHVGQGRYEAAYRAAAPQLRNQHSLQSFRAAMRYYGLHRFKSATWSSREISDGRVTLTGTIRTHDGQQFPATVILVETGEKWTVYSLHFAGPGVNAADISAPGTPRKVPQAHAMNQLVGKSLLAFNASVQSKDFRAFHASLARPLRRKFSPERLKQIFEAFIRHQINIAAIRGLDPTFSQNPSIDKDGLLVVKGFYASTPKRVNFKLSFMMEDGEWRLMSINVSID